MITELYHQESSENCISLIYLGRIGSAWPALIWYIWIKVLTTIPYSLLYAATMNMEIIVPSLVILVGTRALFYLSLLLGILVLNALYLRLYIFVVVLSFIRNCFLEGISLFGHERKLIWRSFHVESVKRQLQLIIMWYAVTYALHGFIYLAIVLPDIAIENYKRMKRLVTVRSA